MKIYDNIKNPAAAGSFGGPRLLSLAVPLFFVLILTGCFTARPPERELLQRERVEGVSAEIERELPELNENSRLNEFVKLALLKSPDVRAAFYDWESAVRRIPQARHLPALRLSFEAEISDMVDDMYMAGASLSIPAPGKRHLRAEVSSLAAEQKEIALRERMLNASFSVKHLAYRLWLIDEKLSAAEEILDILSGMEDTVHSRIEADMASQLDVLRIRMKRDDLANEIADLREKKNVYRERFARAIGLKQEELAFFPAGLPFTEKLAGDDILSIALEHNPRLARARTAVEKSETLVKLAYREYRPDFGIGLMRSAFSSMALTQPMLMLSVPWRGRVKSLVEASLSEAEKAGADYRGEELDLAVMLSEGLFRWRSADREMKLYGERLLPDVSSILEITESRYRAGMASVNDVLSAAIEKLEYQYNHDSAKALREIALNEIYLVIAGVMPDYGVDSGGRGHEE